MVREVAAEGVGRAMPTPMPYVLSPFSDPEIVWV